MDKKVYSAICDILDYADENCKAWLERAPKTHKNRELIGATKLSRKIKLVAKWLKDNEKEIRMVVKN